jgi:pimeloyl-ACP methyl ester carboxylesterase
MAVTTERSAGGTAIRPFTVEIPESDVEDLRARIAATRFPDREPVEEPIVHPLGNTVPPQGVELATMEALVRYWDTEYDLRRVETRLNALPQFLTEIDGLDIHFIHVKSRHEKALPVILIHGWPGSVVEMLNVVGPLTDPTGYGGSAEDAFDVVIPSIPGYGLSGKPTTSGWGPERVASASVELMKRLGHARFVAQGGDWGAVIVDLWACRHLRSCSPSTPTCRAFCRPRSRAGSRRWSPSRRRPGSPPKSSAATSRSPTCMRRGSATASRCFCIRRRCTGSLTRPPAWPPGWRTTTPRATWTSPAPSSRASPSGNLTRDEVLDNITLTWLTNTGISSARLYHENAFGFFDAKAVSVPAAVTVFPMELYQAPRSWTGRAYPNLIYYDEVDRGGHFAAWQEPQLFSEELRAAFRSLR